MHGTHTTVCVESHLWMGACAPEPFGAAPCSLCVFTFLTSLLFVYLCFVFNCFVCFLLTCCGTVCVFALSLLSTDSWYVQAAIIFHFAVVVRGVAVLSPLLLSLCVDVLLVCAEGCTQLTGVMAMMTGRVLLVCALCVLWCLTVFGDARDNRCVEDDGNVLTHTHNRGNEGLRLKADFGLISTRMGLIKAVAAVDGGDGAGNDSLENKDKSPQGGVLAGTKDNEAPGAGGVQGAAGDENGQLPAAGREGNENKDVDSGIKAATDSQDKTNDQLSSSSGSTPSRSGEKPSSTGTSEMTQLPKDTVTKLDADLQDKRESSEGIKAEETEEEERQKIKAHTGSSESKNNGGETTPPPLTSSDEESPISDQENSQNSKKVKNEATLSESKTASEAPAPPSKDATQGQHSHDTDTEDPTKNAAAGS
ncbi:mucin-associated surface protein (MASP), partial [Trypanosoma cruzi]